MGCLTPIKAWKELQPSGMLVTDDMGTVSGGHVASLC